MSGNSIRLPESKSNSFTLQIYTSSKQRYPCRKGLTPLTVASIHNATRRHCILSQGCDSLFSNGKYLCSPTPHKESSTFWLHEWAKMYSVKVWKNWLKLSSIRGDHCKGKKPTFIKSRKLIEHQTFDTFVWYIQIINESYICVPANMYAELQMQSGCRACGICVQSVSCACVCLIIVGLEINWFAPW